MALSFRLRRIIAISSHCWQSGCKPERLRRLSDWEKPQSGERPDLTLPAVLAALTAREVEVVRLIAQRLSNREIAEKLYLSEGSIRQYVNQIYTKLQIAGEPRAKRKLLLDLLADKN